MPKPGKTPARSPVPALPDPLPSLPIATKRLHALLLAAVLLLIFLLHYDTIRPGLDWGDDFAIYLSHALNITRLHPYADTGYIVNPYFPSYAPQAYPPGFPLLLAPLLMLFPPASYMPDLIPIKIFITLCLIASLWLIDRLLRDDLPIHARVAILAGVALSPYVIGFKNAIVSDIPFVAVSFAALMLAKRAEADDIDKKTQITRAALVALVMIFAAQVRSIGVVLPIAFIASQLLRHRTITPPASVVFVIYFGVAVCFSLLKISSDSYFAVLGVYQEDFIATITGQLQFIPRFHATALQTIWSNPWDIPFDDVMVPLCVMLAVVGLLIRLRPPHPAPRSVDVYFVFYYGVLLIYPTPQDYRLLLPIMPLFFFYIAVALKKIIASRFKPLGTVVAVGMVVVTLGCFATFFPKAQRQSAPTDLTSPAAQEALNFIREKTQPGDRILCTKPRAIARFAQRPATPFAWSDEPGFGWRQVHELRPRYLFLGKQFIDNTNVFYAWAHHHPSVFTLVFDNGSYAIFSIDQNAITSEVEPRN